MPVILSNVQLRALILCMSYGCSLQNIDSNKNSERLIKYDPISQTKRDRRQNRTTALTSSVNEQQSEGYFLCQKKKMALAMIKCF